VKEWLQCALGAAHAGSLADALDLGASEFWARPGPWRLAVLSRDLPNAEMVVSRRCCAVAGPGRMRESV